MWYVAAGIAAQIPTLIGLPTLLADVFISNIRTAATIKHAIG
jgi:hypothetical protein